MTLLAPARSLFPFPLQKKALLWCIGMDWSLWIGLVLFFIATGIVAFYLYAFVARIRKEFRAAQPDVRITNLSVMSSGKVLTLFPEFENMGGGVAHDCVLHMAGWDGNLAVKKVRPRGSRHHRHTATIVLGPDAPIRAKRIDNGYLRLRYQDRWGDKYDCWYQVTQVKNNEFSLYNVHIDLEYPEVNKPTHSFWEMRKLLRTDTEED